MSEHRSKSSGILCLLHCCYTQCYPQFLHCCSLGSKGQFLLTGKMLEMLLRTVLIRSARALSSAKQCLRCLELLKLISDLSSTCTLYHLKWARSALQYLCYSVHYQQLDPTPHAKNHIKHSYSPMVDK